jgi:predicted secreted Zn-dependent protease
LVTKGEFGMKKSIGMLLVFLILITGCNAAPAPTVTTSAPAVVQTSTPIPPTATDSPPTPTLDSVETALTYAVVTYYDIAGTTQEELRAQMTSLGPEDRNDHKAVDAQVDWFVYWNWDGYGTSDCDLTTAEVWYEINLTMPNWTPPVNASPELVTKWENYIHVLKEHEAGHITNIIDNYEIVLTAIQEATCETADAAAQTALDTLRQYDIDYDAETSHGATQGVVFP